MLTTRADMGQGAAQAVEDGVALGVVLPAGTSVGDIPERLRLWEQCRKERADFIQQATRVRGRDASGKDGPPQTGKFFRVSIPSSLLNADDVLVEEFNAAFQYALSHNAWEHALNALNASSKRPATASL